MTPSIQVLRNGQAEAQARADYTAAGGTKRKPNLLPPYRPFPVAALPDPIRTFVAESAKALGCDEAFLALPALAVAAGLIGNTRVIAPRRGWREPCVIWSAVVADSGTLKSPAFHQVLSPAYTIQRRLHLDHQRALEQHTQAMETYAADKRRRKDRGEAPGEKPEAPKQQRVICSDITIEKIVEVLDDNPRGTTVVRDELAGWLQSFARYKSKGGGSDLPLWLEAHRAGPWILDRKTGERRSLFVPRAAVSVCGTIQPGTLSRILTGEHLDAGLAARVLFAMPPKRVKRWSELEVSPDTERAYGELLDRLLRLDFDELRRGEPHVHSLAPDAKALWVQFYDAWALEQAAAHDEMAAALSKLEGYAARFALLHHVVTHIGLDVDDRRPIGTASVEAGITLCRWFAEEARRVYALLSESEAERDTRRLVDWIASRTGVTSVKELQRSTRRYATSEHAEAVLEALVQAGLGAWEDRPTTAQGGRPTRVFRLFGNCADETDETPDGMGGVHEGGADRTP